MKIRRVSLKFKTTITIYNYKKQEASFRTIKGHLICKLANSKPSDKNMIKFNFPKSNKIKNWRKSRDKMPISSKNWPKIKNKPNSR